MKADAAALLYLAWRQAVNTVRVAIKRPERIALWAIIALAIGFSMFARMMSMRLHGVHVAFGIPEPWASVLFLLTLGVLGFAMIIAASGNVSGFSSEADARFLTLSKIELRRVLAWLQLRSSVGLLLRLAIAIIFYAVFYSQAGRPGPMALAMAGVGLAIAAVRVPTLRARLRIGKAPVVAGAVSIILVAILGLVAVLGPFIDPRLAPGSTFVVNLGLGTFIRAALAQVGWQTATIWVVALGTLIIGYFGSTDVIPEMYSASVRAIETATRKKRGLAIQSGDRDRYSAQVQSADTVRSSAASGWSGASAIIWKDWLAFARSRSARLRSAAYLLIAATAGAVLGVWAHQGSDALTNASIILLQIANISILFISLYSSVGLAGDLGKPIWWLSSDPLIARLTAWVLASTWRSAAVFSAGLIGCAIAIGNLYMAVIGIPLATAMVIYLRCIGLTLYSIFPAQIDQKGPVALLRVFLAYIFALPVIVTVAVGVFTIGMKAAAVVGLIVAAGEAFGLMTFATARIRNNGAGTARADAA